MSLTAKRTEISDALTAAGVAGHTRQPRAAQVFDGWPLWEGAQSLGDSNYGRAFAETWRVYIVVPADYDAADQWISDNLDGLLEHLAPVLAVSAYGPARVVPDGGASAYNALMITGETE